MAPRLTLESGAALISVLLVTVLAVLLVISALAVASSEIIIAGIQRDAVRALEYAQAGLEEAVRRMERGYPFIQGFSGSLANTTTVSVVRLAVGAGSAYQEVRVQAGVGRATRRLRAVVLQRSIAVLPDTVVADSVMVEESGQVGCGDIYAQTYVRHAGPPVTGCLPVASSPAPPVTYAGWRIADEAGSCTTHEGCLRLGRPSWFPGQRRSVSEETVLGRAIAAQTTRCLPGQGGLPDDAASGTLADGTIYSGPAYGFDADDPDGAGPVPPQAVHAQLPCGLPYKIVAQTFLDEQGTPVTRLFKTVVYEQWLATYWRFDGTTLTAVKRAGAACAPGAEACLPGGREPDLVTYPQYGAIPPVPEFLSVEQNYDRRVQGGGRVDDGDFGCLWPQMQGDRNCTGGTANTSRAMVVLLDDGGYLLGGGIRGHGTLLIDGDLQMTGDARYWGATVARGGITLEGRAALWGTVAAGGPLRVRGEAGVTGWSGPSVPVGRAVVMARSWWER